jgi:cytochrome c biogenesis protein CcmG/thiol:disulfide interchange protein DsbE
VVIFGVNYKDEVDAARSWLASKGDPYRLNIVDADGRLGLDLGVTGAPETYVIDRNGIVRMRYQGPVDERVWQRKLRPLVEELRREASG